MLLTIGIPTYNGAQTIIDCLKSFVFQLNENCEVVISDNCSNDSTRLLVQSFIGEHSNLPINYYLNDENVGMDRNFDLVVSRAKGKFVWILSDDDIIVHDNAIERVLATIHQNPNVGVIFANYENEKFPITQDYLGITGDDFFRITAFKSTLISSLIISKDAWLKAKRDDYFGTYWVHIAVIVQTLSTQKASIVNEVLVKQIIYERVERRWGKNGTFYLVGLDLAKIYNHLNQFGYSDDVCKSATHYVKDKNIWNIPLAKMSGLTLNWEVLKKSINVFWRHPSFWLFDIGLLFMPKSLYVFMNRIRHFFKRMMKKY